MLSAPVFHSSRITKIRSQPAWLAQEKGPFPEPSHGRDKRWCYDLTGTGWTVSGSAAFPTEWKVIQNSVVPNHQPDYGYKCSTYGDFLKKGRKTPGWRLSQYMVGPVGWLYHHPFIVPPFRTRYNPILLLRASIEAILVQVRQDAAEGRQFFQLFVDPCGRRG